MKPEKKARKRIETAQLTRDDWLDAAFQAVVEGGFENLRVLMLADTLGVTRGSFYWHFVDHAELVATLLARWRAREQESNAALESESTADPAADLERLLEAALAHAGADPGSMRFELALRGLGRRDAAVAKMLADVDRLRRRLFEAKFGRLTGDAKSAAELATLFHLAIIGANQALSRPSNPPGLKRTFKAIIANYLIHRQTPVAPARTRRGAKSA